VRLQRFAADLRRALSRAGALNALREGAIEALLADVTALWTEVGAARARGAGRTPWTGALGPSGEEALARCDNHLLALGGLARELGATDAALARLGDRADELRTLAWRLLGDGERVDASGAVRWLEEGPRALFLRAAPVSVARPLQRSLLTRFERLVLTSATLAEAGDFAPLAARLGMEGGHEALVVPSPFDFARQGLLFIPADLPEPRHPGHLEACVDLMRALVEVTEGKALLLFTSWRAMREAWAALSPSWRWPTLIQGEAGKEALLARFRETPDAVLFATQTFWEGVDIPGEALSLLVIDKLPFESPGDPLVEARLQALRREGRDPFRALQVPRAATALRQGLGRLIRRREDRGIAAILDPRLWRASYGATLRAALPPFEVTADLARVERFWRGLNGAERDDDAPPLDLELAQRE
jgi:ATP-dependent DNA helicase DinG